MTTKTEKLGEVSDRRMTVSVFVHALRFLVGTRLRSQLGDHTNLATLQSVGVAQANDGFAAMAQAGPAGSQAGRRAAAVAVLVAGRSLLAGPARP